MFMKTKEDRRDKLASPTMLMKTQKLSFLGHDSYENKGSYRIRPCSAGLRQATRLP